MSTAFGGVAGTVTGTVTPLGGVTQVTYSIESSKVMDTYVGYQFSLANTGGSATATNVSLTVTATASDPAEVVKLLLNADVVLPPTCAPVVNTVNSFTCNVGQLKSGQPFPTFQAFFRAPTKVANQDNTGPFDAPGTDFVNISMTWTWAERTNDQNPNSNSSGSALDVGVLLGTENPTDVKSVVPKSGVSLYTGKDGIPTSDDINKKQAMLAMIPKLEGATTFATANLGVSFVTDDLITGDPTCINLGHFKQCPIFSVSIQNPTSQDQTFPVKPWFTAIYRIDASLLKRPPSQILNSVVPKYTGGIFVDADVEACVNEAPNTGAKAGLPCVLSKQCYKNNVQPVELRGDCEWIHINITNGLTRF